MVFHRLSTVYSIIQMNWRWRQRGYENEASQKSKPKDSELNDGFLKSNDIASRNLYNLRRKSINHLPSSENRRTSEFRERIKFNEKLRCHHCSRYFVTVQSLKQHQITHKSKKFPFICHGCFVRFPTVKTKLAHDRECTRRQFQCYMCEDIVYHQKERLISHMTQHTGQKPFQCQICMKYFMSQNYLKRHLNNIHLSKGQKSYF